MTVTLSPELEALIRRKVEAGEYQSADQIIEEALQLLDERDRERRLDEALALEYERCQRGQVVRWTPELMEQLDREVEERVRRGDKPNSDVCP
jgi:antitoxin ParD1/3/4